MFGSFEWLLSRCQGTRAMLGFGAARDCLKTSGSYTGDISTNSALETIICVSKTLLSDRTFQII